MRILAVSGSLRASSSNSELLRAAISLAPKEIGMSIYEGLGDLPHFNPDLDGEMVSEAVKDWRHKLQAAHGIVFSVPEYAHGVPGVLKNALDWVVGSNELANKPVTLFNASPRATYAQASLAETLTVMSTRVIRGSSVTFELLGRSLSAAQIAADPDMSRSLRSAIESFAREIESS